MNSLPKWIDIVVGIIAAPLFLWFGAWVAGMLYGPESWIASSFEDWFSMEYWMGVNADIFKRGDGIWLVFIWVPILLLFLAIKFKWLKRK